jgi:hypothetical protein
MNVDSYEKMDAAARAIAAAEKAIQRILFDLEAATLSSIENVEVDTRNFGQLRTEIVLTKKQRA